MGWSDGFSCVAAVASAIAAGLALKISSEERATPYKSALYSARLDAIKEYAIGATKFQSTLAQIQLSIPTTIDKQDSLSKLSDKQMYAMAVKAHEIYPAWQAYLETANGVAGLWTIETMEVLEKARKAGHYASDCFQALGEQTEMVKHRPDWWRFQRQRLVKPCAAIHSNKNAQAFDDAANNVLRQLTDELREDSDQFVPGQLHNVMD